MTPTNRPDHPFAVPSALAHLDAQLTAAQTALEAGDRSGGLRILRRLLDRAAPDVLGELADYAAALETASDGPAERTPLTRYVPPSRVQLRRVAPRPQRRRGGGSGDAVADDYIAERGGIDDAPERARPAGYGLDYDLAAVPGVRGAPCLGCRLERTPADRANLDGLCVDCRDGGRTRASVIRARCANVAARGDHAATVELLRRAWRRARRPEDRAVIAGWAAEHLRTPGS